MVVGEVCCSLITTRPPGRKIVWFGAPLTGIGAPLIERLAMSETPVPVPPRTARARALTKSAPMVVPATLKANAASEDCEAT